jgi:hypothetical protein
MKALHTFQLHLQWQHTPDIFDSTSLWLYPMMDLTSPNHPTSMDPTPWTNSPFYVLCTCRPIKDWMVSIPLWTHCYPVERCYTTVL